MLNEATTNGCRIEMLPWGPRVKASHNVNHVQDEKQDERGLQASGESHEDPGSEAQLSLPPGSGGRGSTCQTSRVHFQHNRCFGARQPSHGSELPVAPDQDLLHVHNRSGTGRYFLNESLKAYQVPRRGSF